MIEFWNSPQFFYKKQLYIVMMNPCVPFLSIIIPVFNVVKYLRDCLDSIFCQDVDSSSFEIIIIDDSSPYGEKEIVDTYLDRYDNVRYIRHDVNKRQGGARNTGIRAARGEYVMFIDGDDCIKYQNTFSILIKCVEEHRPMVLRSNYLDTFSNESSYLQIKGKYLNKVSCESVDFMRWRMSPMFSCSSCATLYKRSFLLENNLFFRENVLFEDTDWVQKTMYFAKSIDVISFSYYGYRQSLESTTRGYSIASFEGNVEGVIETYRFFETVKFDDSFREFLYEGFIMNVIGILKMSRNYSLKEGYSVLKRINEVGITRLRSGNILKNIVLRLAFFIPYLPLVFVKFFTTIKRLFIC